MSSNNEVSYGGPVDTAKPVKQGHSFLFCLCDMRITVLFVDILHCIMAVIGIIMVVVIEKYDKDQEALDFFSNKWSFEVVLGIQIVSFLASLFGVLGAACFSVCPVLLTTLWFATYAVLFGIDKNWVGMAVYIFFFYPHAVLCYELAKRIMTKENYYKQEKQCCCVCCC